MTTSTSEAQPTRLSRLTSTIKDLTTLTTAITALAAALFALYTAFSANETAIRAHITSSNATKIANNTSATLAAQANVSEQSTASNPAEPSGFALQLATYQAKDCTMAEQEIASYGNAFSPTATLWREPNGQYVIIGIETHDLNTAQSLQRVARNLSQQPSQAGNDLANAIIRKAPAWTPLKNCPPG